MSHFQSSAGFRGKKVLFPARLDLLFREFEKTEEQGFMAGLNRQLQENCGAEFWLQCFSGEQLKYLPRSTLLSLAKCYAEVFNESWQENWTPETALGEIQSCINCDPDYLPVMTLLFHEARVVGFSWGFIMEAGTLQDNSAPFSSSCLNRHESVAVARYWAEQIAGCDKLVSIRELGVLKEYRQDRTPYLCLPLFRKAKSLGCKAAFLRTRVSSRAFKWSLGIGFVPIQLFMVDGLLLMHGSVKYALEVFSGLIDAASKKDIRLKVITNIKRYLCQY